jgi:hypothetical protein
MGIRKPRLSVDETKRLAFEGTDEARLQSRHPSTMVNPARAEEKAEDVLSPLAQYTRANTSRFEKMALQQVSDSTVDALSPAIVPEKVQVFLSALPPAPGVSNIFDTLCLQYSPAKSLQMILRRAIGDYETMLLDGTFEGAQTSYAVVKASNPLFVYTSRMMEASLVTIARRHFDPLKLESNRALGLKLATAALACFFASEPRD